MTKIPRLPSAIQMLAGGASRPMSRDKSDTLLLLASCAFVLAPHAQHLPLWIAAVCSALLSWRGWITLRGKRMPPRWLLLPLAVMAMAGAYSTYKTFLGRDAGVAMLVLLLTFKLLEMRAKRDLFVVLFLSFFLILANFFYSQSIASALTAIVAVIALLTTQLSFQYTGVVPPLRRRIGLGAFIVALAAPLTLVLFVLFPRIQGPLWGMPGDAHAGHTGLSDSMSPGAISKLAQSDEIAFRVKFIDPAPAQAKLYWRGIVLGDFDGRTWTQLRRNGASPQLMIRQRGTAIRHQVTLEPSGRPWLFALEMPSAAPTVEGNPSGFSADLQLLASAPIDHRVRYDVSSMIDFDLQPDETESELRNWLTLPAGYNPRALALASRWRRQAKNERQIVNAALGMFRDGQFIYTLEPPPLGRDAVDEFLFTTRAGFCEHYAGAFVVLMRAAGIPARVVTGYQGGETNPVDGYMTVRQSDAHAWAEVWIARRGWVRVDPTAAVAPTRIEQNLRSVIPRRPFGLLALDIGNNSLLATLRANWDAVSNAWNQRVLNYNPEKQRNLIRSLGFDDADWRTLTGLMFALGSSVMALIAIPLVMNRRKRDPLLTLYATLSEQMARHGMARAPHEGPRDYAARLAAPRSPLAPDKLAAVTRFLELYEIARYGSTPTVSPATIIAQLKAHLAESR